MKEYTFISVNINIMGFGAGNLDHRSIIEEQAKLGYRYAGYIPTDMTNYGKVREIDLIFERDREENDTP